MQAIMMGPHVMAGLTHNTREITANPDNITNYIHDINEYMLGGVRPSGAYREQSSHAIVSIGPACYCTFMFQLPPIAKLLRLLLDDTC